MPKLLRLEGKALVDLAPEADLAIASDADLLREAPALAGVRVVRVELPKFKDGRAFTQIRLLRQRYGFKGEIRVGGHVIPDQVGMLYRLGADSVEVTNEARVSDMRKALTAYRFAYQRTVRDEPASALRGCAP